jgi:flavin reductase (DIM6/NTAB) family NADH-FMN oxidoreductase RutF
MKILPHKDILELDKYFRINLINTASGIRSPFLVGTADENGQTNLAIFNSVVHIGANPPCLGFIMRPHTVERHTYENIKTTGSFTLNLVHRGMIEQAHHTSASYPREVSEFTQSGLNPEFLEGFPAPFVSESKLKMGMSFLEEHEIQFNNTILIIGKVEKLIVPDEAVQEDGSIDHEILDTSGVSGLYSYYDIKANRKLPFQRPERT